VSLLRSGKLNAPVSYADYAFFSADLCGAANDVRYVCRMVVGLSNIE
jgi:hypothetical protein